MAEEAQSVKSAKSVTSGQKTSLRQSTGETSTAGRQSHVEFALPDAITEGEEEEEEEEEQVPPQTASAVPSRKSIKSSKSSGGETGDTGHRPSTQSVKSVRRATNVEEVGEDGEGDGEDEEGEGEEEEEEDEDDEEEEEEDEDEEEITDDEELLRQRAEEEEALYQHRTKLIERYINAKADYKYLVKKNSYLQDKLYKICLRKGFIVENVAVEAEEKGKRKKKKLSLPNKQNTEDEQLEDLGLDEDDVEAAEGEAANEQGAPGSSTGAGGSGGGFRNFLEAAMESKYQKIIRHLWESEESKTKDKMSHEMNLSKIQEKREKWEKIHQGKFLDLMDRIKQASDVAIDSNTGRHIHGWETEQFLEEMAKIHAKLCQTMVRMYQNRHGLEFALKRLEETEVQGEGLQMLEYEQLQAENYSLKEKLEDRQRDVENIKAKIAHAVQILAHFRECMSKLQEKMDDGNAKLAIINKRVYQVREITDVVTQRYEVYKEEERNLVAESGLLDNTKLLRDFEKTHYDVTDLREEKRLLQKRMLSKSREIEELQAKVRDVQLNLEELQKLAAERAAKEEADKRKLEQESCHCQKQTDPKELKKQQLQRLHWLLETRNLDPSLTSSQPKMFKLPPILKKYEQYFDGGIQ